MARKAKPAEESVSLGQGLREVTNLPIEPTAMPAFWPAVGMFTQVTGDDCSVGTAEKGLLVGVVDAVKLGRSGIDVVGITTTGKSVVDSTDSDADCGRSSQNVRKR